MRYHLLRASLQQILVCWLPPFREPYHGALTDEISGGLHASKYVYGLAKTVSNLGAQLCEHTDVINIEKNDSSYFRLITSKGDVRAKKVIIATNGYTDRLVPRLKPLIFPVGSYIVVGAWVACVVYLCLLCWRKNKNGV